MERREFLKPMNNNKLGGCHFVAMPPNLRQAHQALDRAVDAAYGKKNFTSDAGICGVRPRN